MSKLAKIFTKFKKNVVDKKSYWIIFVGIILFIFILRVVIPPLSYNNGINRHKKESTIIRATILSNVESLLGVLDSKGVFWDNNKKDIYLEDVFVASKPYYLDVPETIGGARDNVDYSGQIYVIGKCCIFMVDQRKLLFLMGKESKVTRAIIDFDKLLRDSLGTDYEVAGISLVESDNNLYRLVVTVYTADKESVTKEIEIDEGQVINSRIYELTVDLDKEIGATITHLYDIADVVTNIYVHPVLGDIVEIGDPHSYLEWYIRERHKKILSGACPGYLRPIDKYAILWVYDRDWGKDLSENIEAATNNGEAPIVGEESVSCPKDTGFYVLTQESKISFIPLKVYNGAKEVLINPDLVHYHLVWFDNTAVRDLLKDDNKRALKALLVGVFQSEGADFIIRFYYVKVKVRQNELDLRATSEITVPELDKLQYLGTLETEGKVSLWRAGRSVMAVSVLDK